MFGKPSFGKPPGAVYAGGTPNFNERGGPAAPQQPAKPPAGGTQYAGGTPNFNERPGQAQPIQQPSMGTKYGAYAPPAGGAPSMNANPADTFIGRFNNQYGAPVNPGFGGGQSQQAYYPGGFPARPPQPVRMPYAGGMDYEQGPPVQRPGLYLQPPPSRTGMAGYQPTRRR